MIDQLIVDTAQRTLTAGTTAIPCLIGKSGAVKPEDKVEGDSATPLGHYRLESLLVRPDRLAAPVTALPWRWLDRNDGWSDDVRDPAYNRPVRHPHRFRAERLWRDDGLYDLIVITSHNTPPVPGAGSAIFLHCTVEGRHHTEGCVAIARNDLAAILTKLSPDAAILVR